MNFLANTSGLLDGADTVGAQTWEGGSQWSVIVVLLVLMIGGLVAAWLFLQRGGIPRRKTSGQLNLLETRVLGGRQYLVVAEYGRQKFLLGVCPGRIDYLCTLAEDQQEPEGDFSRVLERHAGTPPDAQ